jgi:glyoxylase-like metal-dependent hydrolase (beta-lactamase superfamily II)
VKIFTLSALNPGPYTGPKGNNTYLLPGREPTLIDAGVGEAGHLDAIQAALGREPLARVIVTHAHSDHATGVAAIAERWPKARFAKMLWPERDARYAVTWEPLAEGDRVAAGDDELIVVHTPGHAPDHIALWHEDGRTLFSGDLAVQGTTVVIPGTRGGNLLDYMQSLERIRSLHPAVALPAHGPAIYDLEKVISDYVAHRHERERQILDVLSKGPQFPDDIVARLYPLIHPELRGAARESVMAHLFKLRDEGTVRDEQGRWATIG